MNVTFLGADNEVAELVPVGPKPDPADYDTPDDWREDMIAWSAAIHDQIGLQPQRSAYATVEDWVVAVRQWNEQVDKLSQNTARESRVVMVDDQPVSPTEARYWQLGLNKRPWWRSPAFVVGGILAAIAFLS